MTARIWIAGVGNVFFGDDGFGVEVAHRMAEQPLPEGVVVKDYGIRGMHLAYDLLDPPELLVVVDALPHGASPGSTCILEPDLADPVRARDANGHGMDLPTVFATVRAMGSRLPRILIVGCEPGDLSQHMGLTPRVQHAVDVAIDLVHEIIAATLQDPSTTNPNQDESHAAKQTNQRLDP